MDFKVLSKEQEARFQEILRRIQRLQSGGTIDSLRDIGADTERQIGASYLSLKTLATAYAPDETLAWLLWNQQKREEQIVACFLFPANMNKEKITQLANSCLNFEIASYLGSLYLHIRPDFADHAAAWIDSGQAFLQLATLTALARYLILHKTNSKITKAFFQQAVNRTYPDRYVQLAAERYRFNI